MPCDPADLLQNRIGKHEQRKRQNGTFCICNFFVFIEKTTLNQILNQMQKTTGYCGRGNCLHLYAPSRRPT